MLLDQILLHLTNESVLGIALQLESAARQIIEKKIKRNLKLKKTKQKSTSKCFKFHTPRKIFQFHTPRAKEN